MDGERQPTEICASVFSQPLPLEMVNRDGIDGSPENETNGNVPVVNSNILPNRECKPEENLDNDRLNLDLDNHNSRFESLYSQPVEAQDTKQVCNNGNVASETPYRQQEACCRSSGGSNISSSSEDSPVNPPLRRSSKTLSFGKRKSMYLSFIGTQGCQMAFVLVKLLLFFVGCYLSFIFISGCIYVRLDRTLSVGNFVHY